MTEEILQSVSVSTVSRYNFLLDGMTDEIERETKGRYPGFVKVFLTNSKNGKCIFIDFSGETDVCYFGEKQNSDFISYTGTFREMEQFLGEYKKKK